MRSILIADEPGVSFGMPWKGDAPCFNFRIPRDHLRPDELDNIGDKADIETLVIGVDLPDYGFVSELLNLRQLYIYSGGTLTDLSFIKPLTRLRQLYIYDSRINSLEPFAELIAEKSRLLEESEEQFAFLTYPFEAVCINSSALDCAPGDFRDDDILYTREFYINKNTRPTKGVF